MTAYDQVKCFRLIASLIFILFLKTTPASALSDDEEMFREMQDTFDTLEKKYHDR